MKVTLSKSIRELESTSPASTKASVETLYERSKMLSKVRAFFADKDICEVDCPILSRYAAVDPHIDIISATCNDQTCYLHSSPEYGMKRLLAEGMGDIYQLSHVFRDGELGSKHNPEFTMIEWYRLNFSYDDIIEETAELIRLFLSDLPLKKMTYREALKRFANIDYLHASKEELLAYISAHNLPSYEGIENEDQDELLNLILGTVVEPNLGKDHLLALTHYPASQAVLAKAETIDDEAIAYRFEIYYQGIELANGFNELTDPKEQRLRFLQDNAHRQESGKEMLPIDEFFLSALEKGLPECSGVAVGFDRLMMLRYNKGHIAEVIPFSWNNS